VKRRIALAFLAAVVLLATAAVLTLRSEWAGARLCALAAARVEHATGQVLEIASCRIEPLALAVALRGVRLGPRGSPLFEADGVRARLAVVQALGGSVELAELLVERPRVTAAVPARDPAAPPARCPPALLSQVRIGQLQVSDGALDLRLPSGERLRVERFQIRGGPAGGRGLRALAPGPRRVALSLELAGAELSAATRAFRVAEARAQGEVALDLSAAERLEAQASGEGLRLEVRGAVQKLCDPTVDLTVGLRAPLRALLDLAGRRDVAAAGEAVLDLRMKGRPAQPALEADFALERSRIQDFRPGNVKGKLQLVGDEVHVKALEVALAGGNLTARGVVRLGREVALEGQARLDGSELGDILARFGLGGAWVSTRVRGDLKASGTAWPLKLAGGGTLELSDLRVLDHAWDHPRRGERPILEFRRGRLEVKAQATAEGVRIEDSRLRVGEEELLLQAMLHFENARGFGVELSGGVDLGALGHVAAVPMAGRAVLVGAIRAAPYGNPLVEATARVKGFQFLQLDLGDASARVRYGDGGGFVLRAGDVEGRRGETSYAGSLAVDLAGGTTLDGAFEARGRLRDLFEAALPRLPAARVARDALDAPAQVEATLQGRADALGSRFRARLGPGRLLGRPFDSGTVAGRIEEGRRAVFEQAELRRGQGTARGTGRVGLVEPFPWDLEVAGAGLSLDDLKLPGGPWAGSVSGEAHLEDSFERPDIRFAGNGDGVQVLGVPVGSVQLGGSLRQGVLSMTGTTEGVRFSGQARTAGAMPFQARAEVDVEDVTRFFPGGPPAGLRGLARGEATAEGVLEDLGASRAHVSLRELQLGYGDFRVQNGEPVQVATADGRVELRSFTLVGTNTEFALGGSREADGRLSLVADGTLDLRLLGGLVPGVAKPHGSMALEAHVSGTAAEPLLVGAGRLRDAGFQLRDLPVAFSAMNGDLAFSQNRVLFDHLPAVVNGGRADLNGEVELSRLVPAKVRASARLDEVNLRIPSTFPSVVSGQLTSSGSWDAMLLSGRLDVVRASYTERVDLEKTLLEVKRRVATPPVYDKKGEWLRFDVALVLGGDLRVDNDLARGNLRGELNLTGNLGGFGLLGSVTMLPGARAFVRGNEYDLTHAVADFTERRRIKVNLDVQGQTQVRDYQIFAHLFGPFDDPQLQLTSQPSLSQQDILSLLSIGITTSDTAYTGGVGGAAQTVALQYLLSSTGLDEQVKRFLPRGGPVRDLSLRITSAYSEGAGQVVPKAEAEFKLDLGALLPGRDRRRPGADLRFRYQAPISAAAKGGQRAQLEWRLDRHTSLQAQWDTDTPQRSTIGDLGADLRLRWEWTK